MCREYWETRWTFNLARFRIEWATTPDYDCDLSFDDTGETREKIESGEWECFTSRMAVFFDGEMIAADYLGGSIYANPDEFRDHLGRNAGGYGSYFSDMVREAVRDARHVLRKRMETMPYVRTAQ